MKESDMPVREWYSGSFLQNMEKSTSKARKLGDLEDEVVLFPVLGCDMIVLIEIVIIITNTYPQIPPQKQAFQNNIPAQGPSPVLL